MTDMLVIAIAICATLLLCVWTAALLAVFVWRSNRRKKAAADADLEEVSLRPRVASLERGIAELSEDVAKWRAKDATRASRDRPTSTVLEEPVPENGARSNPRAARFARLHQIHG
jgi:hypothetical protein